MRDPRTSMWFQRYLSQPMRVGTLSRDSFRSKLRAPWPMFNWLLDETRRSGLFADEMRPKPGNPPLPLGLKVAASLRYLALGCHVEANEEGAALGRSTLSHFQPRWLQWVVDTYSDEWIRPPRTVEELIREERKFRMCGLPGCIASMDGVHCPWDRCQSQERYNYVGKEGYPTVAWNVCVSHSKMILSVHGPFGGNKIDKTMVRSDRFIRSLIEDRLYKGMQYEQLVDLEGNVRVQEGAWVLCDGGYHRWLHTMAGWKAEEAPTVVMGKCGKRCESIRKDA